MKKAVLIDRDGTIGAESNVIYPTQLHPFPNLASAVKKLRDIGYLVIAVTNQSSIARGTAGDYDFIEEFHSYGLDDGFICPHDQMDNCDCRKPKPGLLLQAKQKYQLDMEACFMIGDRWTDIDAGKACGCKTILVLTGRGQESLEQAAERSADHVARDIFEAVDWICSLEIKRGDSSDDKRNRSFDD